MNQLQTYRESKAMTQQQLAEALDINRATVSKLESGAIRPSLEMAFHIEAVTGVPVSAWKVSE